MNRQQQQALAELRVANAKAERASAIDAIVYPSNTPADTERAVKAAASATHRLERAKQALHQG